MLYLDTSALVSLFVPDAHSATIQPRLEGWPGDILVSSFGVAEFAGALGNRMRAGSMTAATGAATLTLLDQWMAARVTTEDVLPEDHWAAVTLVRDFALALRAPDALHVALCRRLGTALLTFDTRQAQAARRLGVACDPLGA